MKNLPPNVGKGLIRKKIVYKEIYACIVTRNYMPHIVAFCDSLM